MIAHQLWKEQETYSLPAKRRYFFYQKIKIRKEGFARVFNEEILKRSFSLYLFNINFINKRIQERFELRRKLVEGLKIKESVWLQFKSDLMSNRKREYEEKMKIYIVN